VIHGHVFEMTTQQEQFHTLQHKLDDYRNQVFRLKLELGPDIPA